MQDILLALERLPPVAVLRQSGLAYPIVNGVHILGIGLLIGAIAVLDLRILRARPDSRWRSVMSNTVPVAAAGLALALATGLMLFAVRASIYIQNPALLLKWGLIAMGLLNIAAFHLTARRVGADQAPGAVLKLCAAISLLLWIGAIFAGRSGRWIAFID